MALNFPTGFQMSHNEPVDNRLVLTKAEMLAMKKAQMPQVYVCVCVDDGKLYLYNKENESNLETGRFREINTSAVTMDSLTEEDIFGLIAEAEEDL